MSKRFEQKRINPAWLMAAVGSAGLMLPVAGEALTLGALQVLSAPGQALRAEIPINGVLPTSKAAGMRVGMAAPEAFSMMHIPYASALSQWQLRVRGGPNPAILIHSDVPVTAASLDFLLRLDWTGGQIVREYTVPGARAVSLPLAPVQKMAEVLPESPHPIPELRPLPVLRPVPKQTPPAPAVAKPVPAPKARLTKDTLQKVRSHAKPSLNYSKKTGLFEGWSRYSGVVVTPGSSLYEITQGILGNPKITLDQAMAALVKANPQAFIDGNPSEMVADSVMEIPALKAVQSISPTHARVWLDLAQSRAHLAQAAARPPKPAPMPAVKEVTAKVPVIPRVPAPKAVQKAVQPHATRLVRSSATRSMVHRMDALEKAQKLEVVHTAALKKSNLELAHTISIQAAQIRSAQHAVNIERVDLAKMQNQLSKMHSGSLLHNSPLIFSMGGNTLLFLLFVWMLRQQNAMQRRLNAPDKPADDTVKGGA